MTALDHEILDVRQSDAVRVPAERRSRSRDGLTYIVFGAPKTSPNEAIMVQGWWSD